MSEQEAGARRGGRPRWRRKYRAGALLSALSLLIAGTATVLATASPALAAPSALAASSAVIPTSADAGTSATTINNYQQVNYGPADDGSWPCGGNADGATAPCPGPQGQTGPTAVPLGFSLDFLGTSYDSAFVNNNGTLSFASPIPGFTPGNLAGSTVPVIAPFSADVDTRGAGSSIVNFGTGTLDGQKVFVVNWPGVGCFAQIGSVLDNFQLILIDRPDRGTGPLGDDFDIEFNYNTIQWDVGEANDGNTSCQTGPAGQGAYVGYSNGTQAAADSFQLAGSGTPGTFLDSAPTALAGNDLNSDTPGRYLFPIVNNQPPPTAPTTLSTSLSGGGQSGATITVPDGTSVSDSATLTGTNAAAAGGTVTYTAYSDSACTHPVGSPSTVTVSSGSVPASAGMTLNTPGTYYWAAAYSGDPTNDASASTCGAEQVTVAEPAPPSIDTTASAKSTTAATAKVSTTAAGDLLVAFVAGDSPAAGGQTARVAGGGLTWTLAGRENSQPGDAEIWTATAPAALHNVSVTATAGLTGFDETITVESFENATGVDAVSEAAAASGAPTGTVTTTRDNSWVFAVGDDWLHSASRTAGPAQTIVHQATDSVGDTYWVQSQTVPTLHGGTAVTINDTAPTADPYNLVLVVVR